MITDARAFDDEHVPRREMVLHRHTEIDRVTDALQPVIENRPADNVHLFGPSGVGKTTVAKFALRELEQQTFDVQTGYINCWRDHSGYKVLFRAVEALTDQPVHRNSTPRDELVDTLETALDTPAILILDEVDQLEDGEALYSLHQVRNLSLIFIANRELEFFAGLDERIRSRLHAAHRIQFDKYTDQQTTEILAKRVESGLQTDVDRDLLERIARVAAGDARRAIVTLRVAIDLAMSHGETQLTSGIVDEAIPEGKTESRQKAISKLTAHQRVLYEAVDEVGPVNQSDLYEVYEDRVEDPKSLRTVRKYLQKLEQYHILTVMQDGPSKVYSVES